MSFIHTNKTPTLQQVVDFINTNLTGSFFHISTKNVAIYEIDNVPIAMSIIEPVAQQKNIARFYVAETHRGKGVGTRIVRHMIETDNAKVWTVEPLDDKAAAFWEAQGFCHVRDDLYVFQK